MALNTTIPVILESLQKRRAAIDNAIIALQLLADTEAPRRGRKPKVLSELATVSSAPKPRRRLSEETRRKMSEAARKRAERRKAEKAEAGD